MHILKSLVATIASFFVPSNSRHVTIGKLALMGMIVTTFFLFTAGYVFPGGASHYPNWAEAIVNGTKLPPSVAQREVIFPLLYILGGFPFFHSFIGITLIFGFFAILMSILVYLCIEKVSQSVAFYTALACIVTLSPYTYIKFFYPDQAYIFFNLLACTLLIRFIQSKGDFKLLYFFTLAALGASFTRTAGNLMYPVLLTIAYISVRGGIRHYIGCVLVFLLSTGLYQWHRYEIFDMAHHEVKPSGKGMQTIYPIYLYFKDFGIQLSPDELGPNTKRMEQRLREELGTNVRKSAFMQRILPSTPQEFKEKYIYAYTPDQFVHKIFTDPNEEYYSILLEIAGDDDQLLLNVAKEIAIAHPWYIVEYSSRNFYHALFAPGYAVTRYNTLGYGHTGGEFVPGSPSWGVNSADPVSQYGERATKEMQYYPVETAPSYIKFMFDAIKHAYLINYDRYAGITSILIILGWIGAMLGLFSRYFPAARVSQYLKSISIKDLVAPVVVASAFFVYEDLVTSVFCQPVYRYFHLTELLRMIVVGFGVVFLVGLMSLWRNKSGFRSEKQGFITVLQQYDLLNEYFSNRRTQWILLIIGINAILFTWWAISLINHTS